jgi:hypothetical protein
MHDVVRTVFARLFDLDPAIEEPKLQNSIVEEDSELKMSVGATAAVTSASEGTPTGTEALAELSIDQRAVLPPSAALERTECVSSLQLKQSTC